jgi:exosortase
MSENARLEPVKKGGSILSEFQEEVVRVWNLLPHKALFAVLFLPWIGLFQFHGNSAFGYYISKSMFGWLNFAYGRSPDDEHGRVVPFLVLALLWIKRDELLRAVKSTWWPALTLVVVGLLLHVMGFAIQQIRVSAIGFILGLYGITGIVWGRQFLVASFFPMFLLLFCVPAGTTADLITFPLRLIVTKVSVAIAHYGLGIDVFSVGSQIMNENREPLYDVAPACSGMRSLVAMALITSTYSFMSFKSNWRRLVIIVTALPFAVLGNITRITTVIIVGEVFGKQWGALIEQKLGFLTFGVAIGCMLVVGWLLRENRSKSPGEGDGATGAPTTEIQELEAKPI